MEPFKAGKDKLFLQKCFRKLEYVHYSDIDTTFSSVIMAVSLDLGVLVYLYATER